MRESCISHIPKTSIVIVREDYLKLVGNKHCDAALLNYFEHWANTKIAANEILRAEFEKAKKANQPFPHDLLNDTWIYRSIHNIAEDMLGLFSPRTIQDGLKRLVDMGFLSRRRNPKYKWDRAWQYRFEAKTVQKSLYDSFGKNDSMHTAKLPNHHSKIAESSQQNCSSNTLDSTKIQSKNKHKSSSGCNIPDGNEGDEDDDLIEEDAQWDKLLNAMHKATLSNKEMMVMHRWTKAGHDPQQMLAFYYKLKSRGYDPQSLVYLDKAYQSATDKFAAAPTQKMQAGLHPHILDYAERNSHDT